MRKQDAIKTEYFNVRDMNVVRADKLTNKKSNHNNNENQIKSISKGKK